MLQQHLGLATAIIVVAFLIGIYGQITKSRTLTLLSLAIIAVISLLVVIQGSTS